MPRKKKKKRNIFRTVNGVRNGKLFVNLFVSSEIRRDFNIIAVITRLRNSSIITTGFLFFFFVINILARRR